MPASKSIYQLKISLAGISPPVWRRVEVPDCSLSKLHEIIQACMGWQNSHLWAFEIGGAEFADDPTGELEMSSARKAKLRQFVDEGVKKFRYIYDFGDSWTHEIKVEKVLPAEPEVKYPRCVAGSRACPPEDCGGSWGYGDLVEALKNPTTEEHRELLEWVGEEFDPEAFDLAEVNAELVAMR